MSISQPRVRPIVRGKAKANVEFAAKVAFSMVDGYARIDHVQWDTHDEGQLLQESVEPYRERYGYYPEAVLTRLSDTAEWTTTWSTIKAGGSDA